MTHFIYVDIETTGLDPRKDQVTDIAFVMDEPRLPTGVAFCDLAIEHTAEPTSWVLASTAYLARHRGENPMPKVSLEKAVVTLNATANLFRRADPEGTVLLVMQNPSFDESFLRAYHGGLEQFYHYHVLDLGSLVMGAFGLSMVPRLGEMRGILSIPGTMEGAHTALGDAFETRFCHKRLLEIQAFLKDRQQAAHDFDITPLLSEDKE